MTGPGCGDWGSAACGPGAWWHKESTPSPWAPGRPAWPLDGLWGQRPCPWLPRLGPGLGGAVTGAGEEQRPFWGQVLGALGLRCSSVLRKEAGAGPGP